MTRRPTLRQLLILPYVALVLITASVIGYLSYRAASVAVDDLSEQVLTESVSRIAQAVHQHVSGSESVLETAFPLGVAAPATIEDDVDRLRERLWLATSIHRDPNNYAYYGDRRGHFIGLWRFSADEAELRIRTDVDSPRSIYRFSGIDGTLVDPQTETRLFDPRERPWYQAGQASEGQTWTSIYIDFNTLELVGTRARRVNDSFGEFEGVVATDMSLHHLNDFLKTLQLTDNAVAFIVERDGNLLATSRGPHLDSGSNEDNRRLNAGQSEDPLIKATYNAVNGFMRDNVTRRATQSAMFKGPDGENIQAGYMGLQDNAGLDWVVAVATPRSDFMHEVSSNVRRTVGMALLACLLIVGIGFWILRRIADDLRQLARAARRIGDGDLTASIPVDRDDEIGDLAKSFTHLRTQLLTDRLTGIANREALTRRLEDQILKQRRRHDERAFALLFIDLNSFKPINDKFGHDVGDQVLTEVSLRLTECIRERDIAARFGGDEFVVLIDEIGGFADARTVASNIEAALDKPYAAITAVSDDAIHYCHGASIGIAVFPRDGQDVETLLKHADEAMYVGKTASR